MARSFSDWQAAAAALDQHTGAERWREIDESGELSYQELRADIVQMRAARQAQDLPQLGQLLYESIYRHQGDLCSPRLYQVALSGTKRLVEDYFETVASMLRFLERADHPSLPTTKKVEMLEQAALNLGQPALLLSGGASMGFFHLGVVKALFDAGLLPRVICGSSIGSMIAGGVCTRDDGELQQLFSDLDSIYRFGIRFLSPRQLWRSRSVLDQAQYARCVGENLGDFTFAEAARHSGRNLCISVSPARARQKPRLLSERSSPDALIAQSVVASSAIPGLFPAVTLRQRSTAGLVQPYLPAERWADGTFQGDLPAKRLARLYNVNHCIASQVNPHAVPFLVSRGGRGVGALAADLLLSSVRAQTAQALKVLQPRIRHDQLSHAIEHMRLLAEQDYRGDVSIHPTMSTWMYQRMLSNPSVEDLRRYILMGEQATWPKLALIRNQTRIVREVEGVLERLRGD